MIEAEARRRLAIGEGPLDATQIRAAYVRRAAAVRLDTDPDGLTGLREAFELLTRGVGAPIEDVAAARVRVAAEPDSTEGRWWLLSSLRYGDGPEASSVLRDGAGRQPEAFLDELLFHFPERIPGELLNRAREGAGPARLLLLADVCATEGRPADALAALRAALAGAISSPLLRLAVRPVLSLQVHGQARPAAEALALLEQRFGPQIAAASASDFETATMFKVAAELGRLDDTLPLDLRQVAARAAKRGDFQNAAYEAKFAARLMKPAEVGALNERLQRDAPTLAGILGLSLTEDQLRPPQTPEVRVPFSWSAFLILIALLGSVGLRDCNKTRDRGRSPDELALGVLNGSAGALKKQIERDCADPGSHECWQWAAFSSRGDEAPDADGPDPGQDHHQ